MLTDEQFDKLIPGKSVLRTEVNGVVKEVLFKFFMCYQGDAYDGYWLVCTEDLSNPNPHERLDTDWHTYANLCDLVRYE